MLVWFTSRFFYIYSVLPDITDDNWFFVEDNFAVFSPYIVAQYKKWSVKGEKNPSTLSIKPSGR